MKKFFILFAISFFSFNSFAGSLTCIMNEFKEGESHATEVLVEEPTAGGHGGMSQLKPVLFPEISGFISFMERNGNLFAVVSFYSEAIKANSSSQYQLMMDQQYIQHQFVVPNEAIQLAGIEVACMFNKR